eukprot:CAMPEP_0204374278 /NCGR_PEP_ID=MMETSP0469-20131031/48554_1 /ASSEMBLY_ACC=CAM_ASM_000384 /TAXON_ID=2969 /ORGANISM="Oxyrrhis marina" /LENGTH=94 /DNA_ID=CAMNT_0051364843 /DNA_START=237 /DNA_END=519 /DNA_ORIENTATION=-
MPEILPPAAESHDIKEHVSEGDGNEGNQALGPSTVLNVTTDARGGIAKTVVGLEKKNPNELLSKSLKAPNPSPQIALPTVAISNPITGYFKIPN